MGTFLGHLLPGSFFLLASVWWTINIFKHFFRSKCKNGAPFRNQPWYPGPFCTNFPFESSVKIATVTIGMAGELVTAFEDGVFEHIGNAQHMTMYFFFGLNGAMDLLKYYRFQMPDGIEAASGILAYGVEGFLFYNHLHGREPMDVQVHLFLFATIVACILSIFLEIQYRNYVIPSLSRAFFTQMQGTWFCQVGFILYPPFPGMQHWDLKNHEQMMVVTLIYTWHLAVNFVAMLVVGAAVWVYMRSCNQLDAVNYHIISTETTILPTTVKMNGINGHVNSESLELLESDSDDV